MSRKSGLGRRGLGFVSCVVALPLCAWILPGVTIEPIYMSVMLGLIMGCIYLTLRPVMRIIRLPLGCLTMGLGSLAVDTAAIWLLNLYLPGFTLAGPEWALLIAVILLVLRCPILR